MAHLLDISPAEYHLRPEFSSTIAKEVLRSPRHAWMIHPSYGGRGKAPTKSTERGTVVHKLVLGKGAQDFEVLPHEEYRTDKAKADRDAVIASGRIPLKPKEFTAAGAIALAIKNRLVEEHEFDARVPSSLDGSSGGVSEQGMVWTEQTEHGPVECRGMMDHVFLSRGLIVDLKVVEDASDGAIELSAEYYHYALQSCAYVRGLTAVEPTMAGRIKFLFIFAEAAPPYALNIVEPDGVFRELGERRWLRAVSTWGRCLKTAEWPAYGAGIRQITAPAWAMARDGYTTEER